MSARPSLPLANLFARLRLWKPARFVVRARAELEVGRIDVARDLLRRATTRAPAWAEPLYLLSECARRTNDARNEEEALLLAALERDPEHGRAEQALLAIRAWRLAPVNQAWHLFHGGRVAEALDAFRGALAVIGTRVPEGQRGPILAGIGWCHHGLGRADWGVEAFLEALEHTPDLAHGRKGLGICLYLLGQYGEAETELRAAQALEPRMFDALAFVGWCRYAGEDWTGALACFDEAAAGHPLLGDARWGCAWSRWRLDQVAAATEDFRVAFVLDPHHPSAGDARHLVVPDPRYAAVAAVVAPGTDPKPLPSPPVTEPAPEPPLAEPLLALAEGRPAAALELLEALSPTTPGDRWRLRLLQGRARRALDDPAAALEAFREALVIAPGRAEPALDAARILVELDRRSEALAVLRHARTTTANHPDIVQELERLHP